MSAAKLESSVPCYITSNANDGAWHVGVERVIVGPNSGKVLHRYYVTACSGRRLGGPWGQTERASIDKNRDALCPRCARLLAKGGAR